MGLAGISATAHNRVSIANRSARTRSGHVSCEEAVERQKYINTPAHAQCREQHPANWGVSGAPAESLEENRATIDVDGLPGNCARLFRAEKKSRACDFVCCLAAALQYGIEKARQLICFAHI